jgi:hypothetical protein
MVVHKVPTSAQLRAARALIGWSQTDLAEASGVSARTIKAMELAPDLAPLPGRPATIERLVLALAAAGCASPAGAACSACPAPGRRRGRPDRRHRGSRG